MVTGGERFDRFAPLLHSAVVAAVAGTLSAIAPSHELWALMTTVVLVGGRLAGILLRGRREPNLPQVKRDVLKLRNYLHRISNDVQYLLSDIEIVEDDDRRKGGPHEGE